MVVVLDTVPLATAVTPVTFVTGYTVNSCVGWMIDELSRYVLPATDSSVMVSPKPIVLVPVSVIFEKSKLLTPLM